MAWGANQLADIAWHDLPAQPKRFCEPATGIWVLPLRSTCPVAVDALQGVERTNEEKAGLSSCAGAAVEKDISWTLSSIVIVAICPRARELRFGKRQLTST